MLFLEHFGVTDEGKVRQNNEDSLLVGDGRDETLFAVADGIGGFEAGEVASSITIEALKEMEPGDSFETVLQEANRRILAAARKNEKLSGMGTTVVAVRFSGTQAEPVAEVAHVGDSRAYLMRGGELKPITEDHSLVAELVRSGDLTRSQASRHPQKNLITRALGAEEGVEVDTTTLQVGAEDRVMLCSDGLSDMVPESRISEILAESSREPETPARRLLSAALDAGGVDNITVVVVDVKEHRLEEQSGGTHEMEAVPPPDAFDNHERRDYEEPRSLRRERRRGSRSRRKPSRFARISGKIIRGLAIAVAVVVLLSPAYLWGSTRYFLGFDGSEVVAYKGLPYAPLGIKMNTEWRRTNIKRSEIKGPYRSRISEHQLYSRDEAEQVLRDLRS